MMMEFEPEKSHSDRLNALYKISSRLGTTLDLQELLDLVIDSVLQLTEGERGFIVLIDDFGGLRKKAARGIDDEEYEDEKLPVSKTVVKQVVDSGEPLLTDNAQDDPRFADTSSVIGYQFRSIMCAPLRARGRVIGAVFVDNRLTSGVFGDEDLDLLETFANQAAVAIDNAQLFQQTDQALAQSLEELKLFQKIDRELHDNLDLQHTLDLVLHWAVRLTDADWGAVGLIEANDERDGEDEILHVLSYDGDPDISIQGNKFSLTHPAVAGVLNSEGYVHTRDTSAEQSLGENPGFAQLAVPIKLDNQIIGIVILESSWATRFGEEDTEFVNRLSDRAAVAIGNSRLYLRLQKAIEARNTFISLMTHELRIPLTSIRGYADLLAKQLVGPLTDQQANFIDIIRRNISRMSALISDLSDINRMESNRLALDVYNFDMSTAIDEVVNKFRSDIEAKGQILTVEIPSVPVHARADYARTTQILGNLVSNAHRYTPEGGTIIIRLLPGKQRDEYLRVEVEDNGMGMTPEDLTKAADMFFRSENPEVREQAGWGLGLSVADMLIKRMQGKLVLESKVGEGTWATVLIPQANVML
ncbi:MAG: GAF domain-containing sensor histidine kinase [Chloroflexota bacterium]